MAQHARLHLAHHGRNERDPDPEGQHEEQEGRKDVERGPGGKHQPKKPADFTDARRMLAGTSALYTAKIRRGGMGTGMPYWGSIFTEEELTALVDYIWTFSLTHRE